MDTSHMLRCVLWIYLLTILPNYELAIFAFVYEKVKMQKLLFYLPDTPRRAYEMSNKCYTKVTEI